MKQLMLHCDAIDTLPQLHSALRAVLELPDYYGENFDALYDCLTEIGVPTCLVVQGLRQSGLRAAGRVFRQVLLDADENNKNFTVVFKR